MLKRLTALLILLTLVLLTLGLVFLLGMRAKSPAVLGRVRRVNRRVFNPNQMKTAGTPGAYAAIIRHVGRTSGTSYETPVGALATPDGFVIVLPYGSQADWLKNVLASGTATLVHEGRSYEVDQPAVVPIGAAGAEFSPREARTQRLFGVSESLTLRRVDPQDSGGRQSGAANSK